MAKLAQQAVKDPPVLVAALFGLLGRTRGWTEPLTFADDAGVKVTMAVPKDVTADELHAIGGAMMQAAVVALMTGNLPDPVGHDLERRSQAVRSMGEALGRQETTYADVGRYWRATMRLAISLKAARGVATRWQLIDQSIMESVVHFPDTLRVVIFGVTGAVATWLGRNIGKFLGALGAGLGLSGGVLLVVAAIALWFMFGRR